MLNVFYKLLSIPISTSDVGVCTACIVLRLNRLIELGFSHFVSLFLRMMCTTTSEKKNCHIKQTFSWYSQPYLLFLRLVSIRYVFRIRITKCRKSLTFSKLLTLILKFEERKKKEIAMAAERKLVINKITTRKYLIMAVENHKS